MKQQAIVALGLLTLASCVHPSPSPAPETPPEPDAGASAPNEPTPEVRAAVDAALAARRAASVAALAPRTPLAAPLEAPTCDADAKLVDVGNFISFQGRCFCASRCASMAELRFFI